MKLLNKKLLVPTASVGKEKTFTVVGKSFFKITNVYLSGLPVLDQSTFVNTFSGVAKLSASNSGFLGLQLPLTSYTTNNDNYITFTMPPVNYPGFVDVIVENPAGYGALTKYVIKSNYNPFVPGTVEFFKFQPYVRPWSQGIKVIDTQSPVPPVPPQPGLDYLLTINGENLYTLDGLTMIPIQ